MDDRFRATYRIETPLSLQAAAAAMAGEQSTGTFLRLPGETAELTERHGAAVEAVEETGETTQAALPGAVEPESGLYRQGRVTLSWPLANIGSSPGNLLATVLGNLTELRELSGIRLIDLDLPVDFVAAQPLPGFGVPGTRRLTGVEGRPLIGTIVKPSVGLSPEETADLVETFVAGGLDFIKDDELIADPPYSPLAVRVPTVMRRINNAAQANGRKAMYAFNITGTLDEMRRRHDLVLRAGGTCIMVSLNWIGISGLEALRRHSDLPIHGHRNGWGVLSRAPLQGLDFTVYQKLWRLLGADHIHVNGIGNKFSEPDDSVIASARSCLTPLLARSDVDDRIMPVFSSAQTALQARPTYDALGSVDLIYACGGGIIGHPDGVAAGCASIRQAWEAATSGIEIAEHAARNTELAAAIKAFGRDGSSSDDTHNRREEVQ